MKDSVSPKQVARAIGVSESSVKRWCDKNHLPAMLTAGGHRRIAMNDVVQFLKASGHALVEPEVLGLPAITGRTDRVIDRAAEQFKEALLAGDEMRCRQIAFDLFLAEHSVSTICDQLIASVFEQVGDLWECGTAEIYQERLGCEITLRLMHELRYVLPTPAAKAPLAIGGAPDGDQYNLATTMVELVLRDKGWRAVSLGDNLPLATMMAAISDQRPKLFWLSISHLERPSDFLQEYNQFYNTVGQSVAVVVGGRALTPQIRQQMHYAAYCENLKQLEAFAQTLHAPVTGTKSEPLD